MLKEKVTKVAEHFKAYEVHKFHVVVGKNDSIKRLMKHITQLQWKMQPFRHEFVCNCDVGKRLFGLNRSENGHICAKLNDQEFFHNI